MNTIYQNFISAINSKNLVKVKINSKEKGVIVRICIPFDYALSKKYKDGKVRYHFYDLDSPEGKHNLSVLPQQVLNLEILDKTFNPAEYITWKTDWSIKRDWGKYS
jgi:hypothetical protein